MGKIQVVAVNVEGDDVAIKEALNMAAGFFSRAATMALPPAENAAVPSSAMARIEGPAPKKRGKYKKRDDGEAGLFECKHCGEQFDRVGKVAAHTRYKHRGEK